MDHLDDNTVAAFMGGDLPVDERTRLEQHVESCSTCRQLVAAMLKGSRDGSASSEDTLPSAAASQLVYPKGTQLGRYVLLEAIGAGGMGVVYASFDPVLERKVALKLVRSDAAADGVSERLQREGKAIAQLQHPNIVSVFDMGQGADGAVFVAMELVDGGSLKAWLREKPRSWREVLQLFIAAGQGLAAAHRASLVHRDFKPENVLVGSDGRVRVTDFGLAASLGAKVGLPGVLVAAGQEWRLTQSGAVLGTPAYMSPEQLSGHVAQPASDQFSFSVALWEALYGARPYVPAESGQWQAVPVPEDSKVPAWVERAVRRGASLDPSQRWPSMDALLEALQKDPARARRRRLRYGAALGLAVAAAAGSAWWAAGRSERLCSGANEQVLQLWSTPRQGELLHVFDSSGADEPQAAWSLASARLDGYWKAWADMYTDACRATRVRGEQSDELLTRRMACLERRRAEAAALLRLFARGERAVIEKAPEAVDALSSLQPCADAEALLADVPAPQSAATRAQVDAVHAMINDARARFDAGLYAPAVERAAAAVSLARGIGYPPVLAEALVLLGHVEEMAGDVKGAEGTLVEAISVAEGAKQDALTAEAATHLMRVLGSRQARYQEAHAWEKLAEGAVSRIGGSSTLTAQLLQVRGLVAYAEGKLTDAIAAHQRAVEVLERIEPGSLALADAYNSLGAALRGGRKSKEALEAFDRALQILIERVGPGSDLVAATRNGIANGYMLEGRFDEALELYQQAYAVFVKRLGPTHFRTVTTLNNIGVVLAERSKYAEALPYFEQVLKARQDTLAATDAKTADAWANLGMLLVELRRYEEAEHAFEQARGILQGYPLDHFSQAEPLLGEAKLQLAKGEPARAVAALERVLKLCEKREGFRFDYTRARAGFLMGRALVEGKKRAAEGWPMVEKARQAFVGFGAERFARDLAEIDAWLKAHPAR